MKTSDFPTNNEFREKILRMGKILGKYPQIQAAYLFGSQLNPAHLHSESDVDIGVFVDDYDFSLKLELIFELMGVGIERIDLVMIALNRITDIALAYEIVKHNFIIYQRKDFNAPAVYSRIIQMYWDFKPTLERQFESLKKRFQKYVE